MSNQAPNGGNISMVTLGVEDLVRSTDFYLALGWKNSTASQENVRFLIGHDIVLGLYGRAALAEDANISESEAAKKGFGAVTLALNFDTNKAVDAYFERAVAAGAHPQKQPEAAFWGGYSGYFADPDGHLWEVAQNPYLEINEHGRWNLTEVEG